MDHTNGKSPHILNTSSNLLGICFIVLTSLKGLKLKGTTVIDEVTSVAILFFMTSSVLSFLSMRSKNPHGSKYKNVADYIFLSGMLLLFLTAMFIAFNLIN